MKCRRSLTTSSATPVQTLAVAAVGRDVLLLEALRAEVSFTIL